MSRRNAITDIPGIRVGHADDPEALTGCTVILCERGAIGGVDQRGGAPGTRETDLLRPMHLVQKAHAVLLAGGNAGAGMGAAVGKLFGMGGAMKAGIGTASLDAGGGVIVGAIIAVNALGDVVDPATGEILAGLRPGGGGPLRLGGGGPFAGSLEMMRGTAGRAVLRLATRGNTIVGVVATNARLTKEEANQVAQMSHDGGARAIRPAHTPLDGDTLFALSTGRKRAEVSLVG